MPGVFFFLSAASPRTSFHQPEPGDGSGETVFTGSCLASRSWHRLCLSEVSQVRDAVYHVDSFGDRLQRVGINSNKSQIKMIIFIRVTQRKVDVDSLLSCSSSALHSGLSVVRDPTTGMLLDFTEVTRSLLCQPLILLPWFVQSFHQTSSGIPSMQYLKPLFNTKRFYWKTPTCQQKTRCRYSVGPDLLQKVSEEATQTTPSSLVICFILKQPLALNMFRTNQVFILSLTDLCLIFFQEGWRNWLWTRLKRSLSWKRK